MLTSYKMSKTAAGITGDSYQENNLSSAVKAYFRVDYAFLSKGHVITFGHISVCCYTALQATKAAVNLQERLNSDEAKNNLKTSCVCTLHIKSICFDKFVIQYSA